MGIARTCRNPGLPQRETVFTQKRNPWNPIAAAGASRRIRGWDLPTRLFHQSLLASVRVYVGTRLSHHMTWHLRTGHTALALVLFRLIWGILGSESPRFARFVRSPATALAHLRGFMRAEPDHEAGHNPPGSSLDRREGMEQRLVAIPARGNHPQRVVGEGDAGCRKRAAKGKNHYCHGDVPGGRLLDLGGRMGSVAHPASIALNSLCWLWRDRGNTRGE
jgi:hypothetical protein